MKKNIIKKVQSYIINKNKRKNKKFKIRNASIENSEEDS